MLVAFLVPQNLHAFAHHILESGDLASKLTPPRTADGKLLDDDREHAAVFIDRPARDADLKMVDASGHLPKLNSLGQASARAACIERFAHHELMAVELFAWALLAFPRAPPALRRGLAAALEEEQNHLRLYLDRLQAHGGKLGDRRLSGYFWQVLPTSGPKATLLAFLAGQGLTLEQANLDFTKHYAEGFKAAGDLATVKVLQQVHNDEIGHVALAWTWFCRLTEGRPVEEAYAEEVPFPLQAARARGRAFDYRARTEAGLTERFIAYIAGAVPTQQSSRGNASRANAANTSTSTNIKNK